MKQYTVIFLFLFAQLNSSFGQTTLKQLDQSLKDIVDTTKVAGFGVSVFTADSVLYQKGFGYADLKNKLPYTAKTLQNIASVSKTTIGISLLKAQELGLLTLDDPINKHLPFPVLHPFHRKEAITLRQLANHTSTIRDLDRIYELHGYHFGGDAPISLEIFLRTYLLRGQEWYSTANYLNKKPGVQYEYSNIGAGLAAFVIEQASGMSYAAFTRKYIFEPLGMKQTGWFLKEIDTSLHSKLYELKGQLKEIEWYGLATYPDGGLRTNLEELTIYLQTVMNKGKYPEGKLIEAESVAEMLRPFPKDAKPKKMEVYNQGLFWEHEEYSIQKGEPLIGHTGGDPGVSTFMMFDPARNVGYIVLLNTELKKESIPIFIAINRTIISYGKEIGQK